MLANATADMNTNAPRRSGYATRELTALIPPLITEGFSWLVSLGFVGPAAWSSGSGDHWSVTKAGRLAIEKRDSRHIDSQRRLAVGLLPALEGAARSNFDRGDYETASFAAMKAVEVEVRRLGGFPDGLLGTKLMQEAFKADGRLTDPNAEGGEKVALMQLFSGAIGSFKNPASHRTVEFSDPLEAAEVVQLADLLLRILIRVEARLAIDSEA